MDSNNLTPLRKGIVGVQFLFVAFGATVLVPLLVGLDPSTALFTAGIGTLIFHAVTRGTLRITRHFIGHGRGCACLFCNECACQVAGDKGN